MCLTNPGSMPAEGGTQGWDGALGQSFRSGMQQPSGGEEKQIGVSVV